MIAIGSEQFQDIISHCVEEEPIEACGVIAGETRELNGAVVKKVLEVYHCRNELNSAKEYKIGAEEQIKVFSEIEERGLDLLGFYHSHPQGPPNPSAVDEERGNYYGYSYMIINLHPLDVSSWVLKSKAVFKEEEIRVDEKCRGIR